MRHHHPLTTGLILVLYLCMGYFAISEARAGTLNPCEYVNVMNTNMNQLDTGKDDNFERRKQENNQQLVLACQEYEIKLMQYEKNDLNRDNY